MDANSQQELYKIKNELQSIINELYSISDGINKDFDGIGNNKCANSIANTARQCEFVKQKLNSMDLSVLSEEFAAKKRAEDEAKARAAAQAKAEEETRKRAETEAKAKSEAEKRARANDKSEDSKKKELKNVWEGFLEWLSK